MAGVKVPKLRFPEFCGEWQVQSVEKLASVTTGSRDTQNRIDDGIYPFFVRSNTVEKINTYAMDCEAILTSGDGVGVGKNFHYINGKFDFHQRVYAIYNFKPHINGKYFYNYFYENFYSRVIRLSAKNSVDSVRMSMITEMEIPYPCHTEQTKIAEFLGVVDEKIKALRQKHGLLKDYKRGIMQKIFTQQIRFKKDDGTTFPDWEEKKLGDVCKITTGKLDANAMVEGGDYRFYTCAKDYYYIDNYAFDTEALLISGNGANVGYIHYYKGKFNAYQRTYVLYGFCQNIFFVEQFLGGNLSKRIETEKKAGNTPYIVLGTLYDMIISFPHPDEQQKIADFLSSIDNKIDATQSQIDQMTQFKKGLLQQMFV